MSRNKSFNNKLEEIISIIRLKAKKDKMLPCALVFIIPGGSTNGPMDVVLGFESLELTRKSILALRRVQKEIQHNNNCHEFNKEILRQQREMTASEDEIISGDYEE